jgi:adenosylmethionine-8-amino-7-oxononanoate aminotransferase
MRMHSPEFLRGLAALARRFQLPLVLDEVFTGFGRAGAPFAFQRAGIEPDVVCTAKAITGGNLPLAATLAREDAFAAFLSSDKAKALLHGHSYTGNAIACAAALATLDIFERERLADRALRLERRYGEWIATTGKRLALQDARALGGILAFELPASGRGTYFHPAAARVQDTAAKHGLFLRPLGNTLYFMPPLVISDAELETALAGLAATVDDLL